jgi:hypothetical protein
MVDAPNKISPQVIAARKQRVKEQREEARALKPHKKRLRDRLFDGRDWPIDARTGDRAEIDHGDVMAPLPDDLKVPVGEIDEKMHALRKEADKAISFNEGPDRGVVLRRHAERQAERIATEAVRGGAWTVDLVQARIEEAFRTLARAGGGRVGPREFGNGMPAPIRAYADLVNQAGNASLRRAMERLARYQGPPTSDEVRRMGEALGWSLTYLRNEHPDLATFVNLGGMWKAWDAKVSRKCRELGIRRQDFYRFKQRAIEIIVEGLKKEGKAPT